MEHLEHQIQHFKAKAYYKASNNQCFINIFQKTFDILEEVVEPACEGGRNKMHFLEEALTDIMKILADIVAEMRCDAHYQIDKMKYKVYANSEKVEETRCDSRR